MTAGPVGGPERRRRCGVAQRLSTIGEDRTQWQHTATQLTGSAFSECRPRERVSARCRSIMGLFLWPAAAVYSLVAIAEIAQVL